MSDKGDGAEGNEEEEDDHGISFGYQEEGEEGGGDREEELDDEINFDEI